MRIKADHREHVSASLNRRRCLSTIHHDDLAVTRPRRSISSRVVPGAERDSQRLPVPIWGRCCVPRRLHDDGSALENIRSIPHRVLPHRLKGDENGERFEG